MNLTNFQKRAIINVAKSVLPLKRQIATLQRKKATIEEEIAANEQMIASMEATITPFTDGKTSDQLVKVVPQAAGANKYIILEEEEQAEEAKPENANPAFNGIPL